MTKITFRDPEKNRTAKTNRWLNQLTFCMMILVGAFGFSNTILPGSSAGNVPSYQPLVYCTPGYGTGCSFGDDISNVTLQGESVTLNNSTSTCSGNAYQDFTSLPAPDLAPGNSYTISVSSGYGSPNYEDVKIWIDFDNDTIFSASEVIANTNGGGLPSAGPGNFTFTVPTGVTAGDYRMRVRLVYSSSTFDACSYEDYGETEDYMVSVIQLNNCSGTPTAGTVTTPINVCAGNNFTLSTTGATAPADGLTGIWQSSPAGAGTWTNVTGATSISYTMVGGVLENTDFRYQITCSYSSETAVSGIVQVTMNPATDCYCTPTYTFGCTSGDRISNVTLQGESTTLNNSSQCSPAAYGDFTAVPSADLAPGNTYTISVSTDYSAPTYEQVKAWIDYNEDGFFSDTELIANTFDAGLIGGTGNFTFTVPTGLSAGDYRLRVRMVYGSSDTYTACDSASFGETEDYTIQIIQLDDCVGTPNAGTVTSPINACANINFMLTTLGATAPADGLTGIWQSSPAGMNTWTDVAGATSVNYTVVGGITSNTDFRYKMTCSYSNETDISGSISVIMNDAIDCYCIPIGTSTSYYITDFTTTGGSDNISNTNSGLSADGYGDFYLFHNVTQEVGDLVFFEMDATNATTVGFKIWVDWNQNGSFDDPGEMVYASSSYQYSHSGSFLVPNDAMGGQTRMRIGNASSTVAGPTSPCLTNLSGEYEDYMFTVLIPDCAKPFALTLDAITPHAATISWTSDGTLFDVELGEYGFFQSGVPTASGITNPYITTPLIPSTSYEIYVRQDCGVDGFSDWAGPFNFTAECLPPTFTSTTGDTICGEGEATLSAVTDGDVVFWYTDLTGGTKIGEGMSFVTPNNLQTTDYYAETGFVVPNVIAQIGEGTTTATGSGSSPYYHGWGGVKTQYIYKVEELLAAGLSSGPVTSLAFEVTASGSVLSDFTVYMGTTSQDAATTTHVSGLTLVYSNPSQSTSVGINTYIFSQPFIWDGTSNIVVQTSFSNNNTGGTSASTRYHTVTPAQTTYTYADNRTAQQILDTTTGGVSDGSSTSGSTSTVSNRANTYLNGNGICASERVPVTVTVTTAPDFALAQTALEICEGDTSDAVTIATGATDYDTYVWSPSLGVSGNATDGWSFDPIETTTYVLSASQSTGSECLSTFEVQVDVNPLPMPITIVASETEVCEDAVVALSVTGNINNGVAVLGDGTTAPTSSYPNPFNALYGGAKHQMLYTAAELTAQGMMAGSEISAVTFDNAAVTGGACVDFTIRMGATTTNVMTAFVSGTTTVYGPTTFTPSVNGVGLASFTLTTPYVWDGVSNLIVETVHNAGNYGNGSGTTTKATTTAVNTVFRGASDGVPGGIAGFDGLTSYATSGAHNQRANMTFTYTFEQMGITWSPATNLYTDAAATTAYVADDLATAVYFKPSATGVVTYTATSTTDEGCFLNDMIDLTVNETPDAPVATSPQSIIDGQTIADIVVTGTNLTWYTDAALTDEVDDSTVLVEGSYTFYVTASMGDCTSEATEIIVEVTLSTKDFDSTTFKAYPNPVKDYFNISYSKDIQNITVINMLGQTIFTKTVNATDTQIDMTSLPTGSYFVKVNVDGAVKTIKVVKQ